MELLSLWAATHPSQPEQAPITRYTRESHEGIGPIPPGGHPVTAHTEGEGHDWLGNRSKAAEWATAALDVVSALLRQPGGFEGAPGGVVLNPRRGGLVLLRHSGPRGNRLDFAERDPRRGDSLVFRVSCMGGGCGDRITGRWPRRRLDGAGWVRSGLDSGRRGIRDTCLALSTRGAWESCRARTGAPSGAGRRHPAPAGRRLSDAPSGRRAGGALGSFLLACWADAYGRLGLGPSDSGVPQAAAGRTIGQSSATRRWRLERCRRCTCRRSSRWAGAKHQPRPLVGRLRCGAADRRNARPRRRADRPVGQDLARRPSVVLRHCLLRQPGRFEGSLATGEDLDPYPLSLPEGPQVGAV